jgi:hypothetical protein
MSTRMMQAADSSEMLVPIYKSTLCHISEDAILTFVSF